MDWHLWLEGGLFCAVGVLTYTGGKRRRALERQLHDARRLGQVGEGVARLAHGLKNVVHSLRGFTALAEGRLTASDSSAPIIAGLRLAIDRLEEITDTTLRPPPAEPASGAGMDAAALDRTLEDVIAEVSSRYPSVQWVRDQGPDVPVVAMPRAALREVLLALVENAAEASGGIGDVVIQARRQKGAVDLVVRDHGQGIDGAVAERLFGLGATTKPAGHGFGLFLARRLVESRGGRLTATPAEGGGARFSISLPAHEN